MKTDLILLIVAIAIFIGYLLPIALRYGIHKSISATYNSLTQGWKMLYSLFIIGIAIPMMIISDCTLGVWAGIVLSIDAAAPTTRNDKFQMFLHCFGANVGIGLGIAMIGLIFHQWYLVAVFVAGVLTTQRLGIHNKTYWTEVLAFAIVMSGLLFGKIL